MYLLVPYQEVLVVSKFRGSDGRVYSITPVVTATAKPKYLPQGDYDEIVDAMGQEWVDAKGLQPSKPRVSGGKTIRKARADGDGGTCPYFGLDYTNRTGVHHPADCGKEHDGKFAKKGTRSAAGVKGAGYEGHMEWAADVSPSLIKAARVALAKKAS